MAGIQKTGEEVSPTTALTEFHCYPRLAPELKVMIWEQVFAELSSGAHRFRLTIDPESRTELMLRPDNDQKDDVSAWRERLALANTDDCSKHVFDLLQRKAKDSNQLKLLYKDTLYRRTRRVEENGVAAEINAETDLVTFRFNYGTSLSSLALLNSVENRDVFAGITRVGIEVDFLVRGCKSNNKRYKPFRCTLSDQLCIGGQDSCPVEISKFLRSFKDLQFVYIIFTIDEWAGGPGSALLSNHATVPRRLTVGGPRKRRQALDIFQVLQDVAQQKGFDQFHDRSGTYCEVSPEQNGGRYMHFFHLLRILWTYLSPNQQSVQFKSLFRVDLRGATDTGNGQQLRRAAPW